MVDTKKKNLGIAVPKSDKKIQIVMIFLAQ